MIWKDGLGFWLAKCHQRWFSCRPKYGCGSTCWSYASSTNLYLDAVICASINGRTISIKIQRQFWMHTKGVSFEQQTQCIFFLNTRPLKSTTVSVIWTWRTFNARWEFYECRQQQNLFTEFSLFSYKWNLKGKMIKSCCERGPLP